MESSEQIHIFKNTDWKKLELGWKLFDSINIIALYFLHFFLYRVQVCIFLQMHWNKLSHVDKFSIHVLCNVRGKLKESQKNFTDWKYRKKRRRFTKFNYHSPNRIKQASDLTYCSSVDFMASVRILSRATSNIQTTMLN